MTGLRRTKAPDSFVATGPLDAIGGPGRRTVRRLELQRASGDLSVLAQFGDLEDLVLRDVEDCTVVQRLALAERLVHLTVVNDAPDVGGEAVQRVIEAVDFGRLGGLLSLTLRVGGVYSIEPIAVDLGFLAALPALERLDLYEGILHAGPGPSPLEPPFPGLSRALAWVRISAPDPEPVQRALAAYLGHDDDVSVLERTAYRPRVEWEIGDGGAYGSLLRHMGGETEYDAAERAQRRLREADPGLAERVDFDPESSGTGITAASRDDLAAALRILGLIRP